MVNVSTADSQSKYGLLVSNAHLQAFNSEFSGSGTDIRIESETIAEFYDVDANEVSDVTRYNLILVENNDLLNKIFDTTSGTLRAEEIAEKCLLLINLLLNLNGLNELIRE
ncbi:hypothetical protein [Halalkalicoccus tibetensis]|uniref:Uncharacterized protein n=1 Tax=Halalkalicoccus tibetensis TaxID=175632 RepID=A0ABD5V9C9_9EURY